MRDEHCDFAKLDNRGKCTAYCAKNRLKKLGDMVDCMNKRSETVRESFARMEEERKMH